VTFKEVRCLKSLVVLRSPFTSRAFTEAVAITKEIISVVTGDLFTDIYISQDDYTRGVSSG